jgi:inner membrane protein COX18
MRKKRKELYKMFGCQSYKNFLPPIVQFPLFITVIETIRGLCGTTQGFWRMLLGSDSTPINAPEVIIDAVDNLSDTIVPPSTISQILTADPSMATEGMLWFTDLTAPDPMLILPFMLSATIFLNLIPKHYFSGRPAPTTKPGPIGRGLSMFMKVFALAIGPMTLQIPSAMLLYWISSSGLAFAQGVLLDIFSPIGNPVTPCVPPPSKLMGNAKPETRVRDKVLTKLIEQNGKK